jgi:membrane protease YdiL (CAAX protease family)
MTSSVRTFIMEVVLLLVLPIWLFSQNNLAMSLRPYLMILGGIYCFWRFSRTHYSNHALGLTSTNLLPALLDLLPASLVLIGFGVILFWLVPSSILYPLLGNDSYHLSPLPLKILIYVVISVPIQEFIFRGYLTLRLRSIFSNPEIISIFSATIFTFVHLPFHSFLLLLVTAIMGILYIHNYTQFHNLYALMFSHAVIGVSFIYMYAIL